MKKFIIEITEDENDFPLENQMFIYSKVSEMTSALWNIAQKIRNWQKYYEGLDPHTIEIVCKELREELQDVWEVIEK